MEEQTLFKTGDIIHIQTENHGKIGTAVVKVTPEIASEILENQNNNNRPLNDNISRYYALMMERDLWFFNGETIVFSNNNQLLNGQHRLGGIIESGITQELLFVYGIDPKAFSTYDQPYTRSVAHLFSLSGVKNSNVKAAIVTKYMILCRQGNNSKSSTKKQGLAKLEYINEYLANQQLFEIIYSKALKFYLKRKKMLKPAEFSGYMAYLLMEKNYEQEAVFSFFKQLVGFEMIKHPAVQLLEDKLYNGNDNGTRLLNSYVHAYVVKAWNAYITDNTEIKKLSYNETKETTPQFLDKQEAEKIKSENFIEEALTL